MALSMEEQRILAEMERNLAADDPRLASRLTSFGQPRMPRTLRSQRVRTIAGLLALGMIAAVTITMFMLSPYVNGRHSDHVRPGARTTAATSSRPATTATHSPPASKTSSQAGRTASGANKANTGSATRSRSTSTKTPSRSTGKTPYRSTSKTTSKPSTSNNVSQPAAP